MKKYPHVVIFTDGACHGNPGPGGWGALLRFSHQELTAAIKALDALKRSCRVDIYTDSQYVRRGITEWMEKWKTKGWKTAKKKPVKNQELWRALDRAVEKHEITWHWVRGHTGHRENERVDRLARRALNNIMK